MLKLTLTGSGESLLVLSLLRVLFVNNLQQPLVMTRLSVDVDFNRTEQNPIVNHRRPHLFLVIQLIEFDNNVMAVKY